MRHLHLHLRLLPGSFRGLRRAAVAAEIRSRGEGLPAEGAMAAVAAARSHAAYEGRTLAASWFARVPRESPGRGGGDVFFLPLPVSRELLFR